MTERDTGRSRGFGFVTFQDEETLDKVLASQHSIQGKPVEVKRAEPKKVDRQPRPIIVAPVSMPGGMYIPHGYPYPLAYANPALYGQALSYDPGFFIAPQYHPSGGSMYAPQFVPIEDSMDEAPASPNYQYEEVAPVAPPARASRRAVVLGPKRTVGDTEARVDRAWNAGLVPVEIPSISLRVPGPSEVRSKRGMSQPEPERNRRSGSAAVPSLPRRSVVTTSGSSWRSRHSGVHGVSSTATINPSSAPAREGHGALHKYFQ